jgi:hypothetical protein
MRCPACGHQQKFKDGSICHGCWRVFLISPKVPPYLSDHRIERAAARVSANSTRWYTTNQLVADLAKRRRLKLGLLRMTRQARVQLATGLVVNYAGAGRLPGCIMAASMDGPPSYPWPEPDLYDYGAERVLVVDERLLVDLLVRNGVHAESRTIVVSVDGYPSEVARRAAELVAERPDVPVYVLHGTNRAGGDMVRQARELLGAPGTKMVIDLGLAPDAPKRLKVLRWARRLTSVQADHLPYRYLTVGLLGALMGAGTLEAAQAVDDGGDGMALYWLASLDDFG